MRWLRQAGALTIYILALLIPVVPWVVSSTPMLPVLVESQTHPACVHLSRKQIFVADIGDKKLVPLMWAFKDSNIVLFPLGNEPVEWDFFPPWGIEDFLRSLTRHPFDGEAVTNLRYAGWHAANVGQAELHTEASLLRHGWWVMTGEYVGSLNIFSGGLAASHSEQPDDYQAVGKKDERPVGKFSVFAKKSFREALWIVGASLSAMVVGAVFVSLNGAISVVGGILMLGGAAGSLYGPSLWGLWAQ